MNKKTILIMSGIVALAATAHNAAADLNTDAETIFNWGESKFPEFLSPHDTTKTLDIWLYREYPKTGVYAGINTQDNGVYVLGGIFGNSPVFFDSVANVLTLVANDNQPSASGAACDNAKMPPGVSYTQEGNILKITTNGNCVALPTSSLCVPPAPTASGLSVLSSNNVKEFSIEGIKWSNPQLETAFTPQIKEAINAKTCLINGTQAFVDQITETDVCFDVTSKLGGLTASLQNLATVTPPVNMRMKSSISNQTVADCFKTDADIVTDALTNEVWTKENGSFVKVQ